MMKMNFFQKKIFLLGSALIAIILLAPFSISGIGFASNVSYADATVFCQSVAGTLTTSGNTSTCTYFDPQLGTQEVAQFDQNGNPITNTIHLPPSQTGDQQTVTNNYNNTDGSVKLTITDGSGHVVSEKVTKPAPDGDTTCSWNPFYFSFANCIWIPFLTSVGQLWLAAGSEFLTMGGVLFDTLVNGVIINFAGSLSGIGATDKITIGWDLFRDLSNILIIGMFVFIAISTILGSKEYGYKKLVARVLVIAVLMNFSLLFTKLIIDASNFTAYQFYNQMAGGGSTATATAPSKFNIAQAFLNPMGITSIWQNSGQLTATVAKNVDGSALNKGLQALLFGIIGGILLLIIGGVLFYGAFLIATRAVLLVVLMATASVAFATYLIPNFAGSKYGWKGWWGALINCAVFAPLLMLFLALSVVILQATNKGTGTLGGIISDPTTLISTAGAWNIILIYIMGVGLLFVSLKISSQFATTMSGLNIGSMLAGYATGGLSSIAGFAGRNSLGRIGMSMAESKAAQANAARDAQAKAERQAQRYTASGRHDLANIAKAEADRQKKIAANSLMSAGRYSGIADAKFGGKQGLKSRIDAQGAEGAKIAKKLAPDKDAKDQVRKEAEKEILDVRKPDQNKNETEVATAKTNVEGLEKIAREQGEVMKNAASELASAQKTATEKKSSTQSDHEAIIAEISKKIAEKSTTNTPESNAEVDALKEQRQRRISERAAQFKTEDDRISNAQIELDKIKSLHSTTEASVAVAKIQRDNAIKKLNDFNADTKKIADLAANEAVAGLTNSASAVAGEIAVKKTGFVSRFVGAFTGDNEKVRHAAMHTFGHAQSKDASLKKLLQDAAKETPDEGH